MAGKVVVDDGLGEANRQTEILQQARFTAGRPIGAYAMPSIRPNDGAIRNGAGRTTVPFKLINNHIYAEVTVNGKGPFLFIFDTGGHDLLTPETAKALSVVSEGQAAGTGAGESTVDVSFAKGVTFQIGDLVLQDQTITVLPFEAPQVEGFPEQGMIGFEVFRRFVTEIDYGKQTLTFIDPAKFDPRGAGVPVPFVFYSQLPQVKGAFEGLPGVFDIDTGSRVEVTLTKPFVDANGLRAAHPKGVTAVDGWGVGGRSISYITRGKSLFLGPVRIPGVVAGMATQARGSFADPNYQGNVGGGVLKRFVVTFDYDRQIMFLKPLADPGPDVGVFDRAGFWINTSTKGFKIVDLTAGGAAQAAGLKVGDEITAVDGAPAGAIAISDLRSRLRTQAAGSTVTLAVDGAGGSRQVVLTLKDQI
ncbi:MAG: aspartyl protease family protein [Phenylobacterium sp.]|nr:aspartyl protease family protein [Phenylobacterium sp.]